MGEVVSLAEHRPHLSGRVQCLQCGYRAVGVMPVGDLSMECPECKMNKMVMRNPVQQEGLNWTCTCSNQLFTITPSAVYCANCGATQRPFDEQV